MANGTSARVRAIVLDAGGRVLLGKGAESDEYLLPGGHIEEGEHPVDAILREVCEETSLQDFAHFEFLFEYLDNYVFLFLTEDAPVFPQSTNDPDSEFSALAWFEIPALPNNMSEYASDILFKYLHHLESGQSIASPEDSDIAVCEITTGAEWSDYIRGEFWLTEDGQSEFADIDTGEAGHEYIATRSLLSDFGDEFREVLDPEHKDNDFDENLISHYFEGGIKDEDGKRIMGPLWDEMKTDVRLAYAKKENAILVIDSNFAAYKVTKKTISAIQDFIYEQIGGEDASAFEDDPDVVIEEYSTQKNTSLPLSDFLNIKNPGELWRAHAIVEGGKIEVMVDGVKVQELDDNEIWETLPRLAQERAKGKKISYRQILDDGTIVDFNLGVGIPKEGDPKGEHE